MSEQDDKARKAAEEEAGCCELMPLFVFDELSGNTDRVQAMARKIAVEFFLRGAAWAAPKWVSVKERLPQNSQTVLVYIPFSDMFVGIWSESKNHFVPVCEWVNGRDYDIENIHIVGQYNVATHWQPLPAAPEVE